ncbi:hypothetical protein EDC04DRAFT_231822 [Pisolithus marmoratus]|nr:hypothetical protein EDC04DRAFT_231822 [Pisolithus marmoratus]
MASRQVLITSNPPTLARSPKKFIMANPFPSAQTLSVCLILISVFQAFAICLTAFRLGFRYYTQRLWWDDFWAFLSSCCTLLCLVASWFLSSPMEDLYIPANTIGIPPQSRTTHVISWWMEVLSFTCAIWFARLSIVSSFIRIAPPSPSRTAAFGAAAIFVLMWLYMMLVKAIPCAMDRSWYNLPFVQCPIPEWVVISEVITDSLSDFILVCLPLRLLWRLRVPSHQRTMILAVFSSSLLTTIVSGIHTVYTIPPTFIGGVTADIEAAVALVVCNLLVVVTFIYRIRHGGCDMGPYDKDMTSRLTTIELGMSGHIESQCPTINPEIGTGGRPLGTTLTRAGVVGTVTRLSPRGLTTRAYSGSSEEVSEETYLSILSEKYDMLSAEKIGTSLVPTITLSSSSTLSCRLPPPPKCLSQQI